MKKSLKTFGIFLSLNILTLVISGIFWNIITGLLIRDTPDLNASVIYGIYLYIVLLNIYLINSYIKTFTSKKILLIISLVFTILFAVFIGIKGESLEITPDNRYESRIKYTRDNSLTLYNKHLPTSRLLELDGDFDVMEPENTSFISISNGYIYWLADERYDITYYKTNLETGYTSSSYDEF